MRIIDADALLTVVKGHHDLYNGATNPTDKARRDELHQVMADIVNASTINAIPVEWLKQQRECNDPESVKDINGAFVSICIYGVLALWQKEQEAGE